MAGRIDAIGGNVQIYAGLQSVFATPVAPTTRLRLKLPEDLKANREFYISEEPTPQRGRVDMVETSRAAGGPLNYDLRTEGMGLIYRGALGSAVDVVTVPNADGGVRARVDADYTAGSTYLYCDTIPQGSGGFSASGRIAIAYRTSGDTDLQLIQAGNIQYSSIVGNAFVLTTPLSDSNVKIEDFVFQYSSSYSGVYTHVYEAGNHLDTILTYGILRDIVCFYYYSCKTNTWTETYDNQAVISGTIEVVAGDEFYGGVLNAQVGPTNTSLTIKDVDNDRRNFNIFYPSGGTIWIGDESGITFTAASAGGVLSGIPAGGTGAITEIHYTAPEREVVAAGSITEVALASTDTPLASYNAGIYTRADVSGTAYFSQEVLSANFTVNNNLFTEKIPLGTKERIALPPGQRDTTGTIHVEFDSPEEYNRVTRGTRMSFEIRATDALSDISSTGVIKRNDTLFQSIKFLEATPTAASGDLIEYDLNFRALVGRRWSEIQKVVVNGQSSSVAGG